MGKLKSIKQHWHQLYGEANNELLDEFIQELKTTKQQNDRQPQKPQWYKDAVVYSLYVDLFNRDFRGLTEKLDYISDLGANCLWLLPILDSPMRDAGFDIRNYTKVRDELTGLPEDAADEEKQKIFNDFLEEAHRRDIRVIFDIALNHTSNEHPWFIESRKGAGNPYRDYYIWNKDTNRYTKTRLLFKGMEESNWEKDGDWYYFHRFFNFQPDLNYHNPKVLVEMSKVLLFWLNKGVDGFRADAVPYLWKEEGTSCENLPQTHLIVKIFRAALDFVRPNTLLLAEACQKPKEVVKYFGDGDECHAGYHFPLMPQMFKTFALHSNRPVVETLSPEITPPIPESAQWFTFLRCHDELSLERVYVSEKDRALIHKYYCRKPEWDFRQGEGISARLAELLERDPEKIALAFSVMFTLPGTPIVYYGDEFGKLNDEAYYRQKTKETGKDDTRFLVRGYVNWQQLEKDLANTDSLSSKVYQKITEQINIRKKYKAFGRGDILWVDAYDEDGRPDEHILAYIRKWRTQSILVVQNLLGEERKFKLRILAEISWIDLFGKHAIYDDQQQMLTMQAHEYLWIKL